MGLSSTYYYVREKSGKLSQRITLCAYLDFCCLLVAAGGS